jgi:hypothetical protein
MKIQRNYGAYPFVPMVSTDTSSAEPFLYTITLEEHYNIMVSLNMSAKCKWVFCKDSFMEEAK